MQNPSGIEKPGVFTRLLDKWIARYAQPSAAALDAVAGLKPAVVVTGGSRGIGLALARRFAKAGHDVAILARNSDALQEAAAAIERNFGVKAHAIVIDVTEPDAPRSLDTQLAERGCYMDVLVNSAGIGLSGRFESHSEKDVVHLLDLNVRALTRWMRHALPAMLARGRGGILNVASLGGLAAGPYQAAYYASKAYVISLTEAAAWENAGEGVRLTVLAPGPVNTSFHEAMGAESSFYRQLLPALSPEHTANSAYNGFVLGRCLIVPGVINTFMAVALRILPHTLLLPLVGWLLRPREELQNEKPNDGEH
ncbi:MAG: SDR family NAD(P)-dependent oxidoreductase [Hyphomicrobium sp.]